MTCFVFSNNGTTNEDVRGKSWYFGPISRADCDVLMAEKGQDGDFLVRDSESTVSCFVKNIFDIINLKCAVVLTVT